jgi:hypothetical protein
MNVSPVERLLFAVTLIAVLYRIAREEWPVGLEVEPTESE